MQISSNDLLYLGMMVRVFANGLGDLGLIPCHVIPMTQKCYLMPLYLTLNIMRKRVKYSNPKKEAIEKGAF